jgi:flavin reductase (DIM6/NTAB) family NADH-FMN oxidoreductase RutF
MLQCSPRASRFTMDPKIRQKALRLLTNGMYVLTARSGQKFGAATVTWVSQASFKPPLLMAALRKDGSVFECLSESRAGVLHVLAADQKAIAQKFFAPTKATDGELNGEPFTPGSNDAPVLSNLPAYLECSLVEINDRLGDHAIVVLEVTGASLKYDATPLTVTDSPWEYGG